MEIKSSLLKDSKAEWDQLTEDVRKIAEREMISEAKESVEARAKQLFESIIMENPALWEGEDKPEENPVVTSVAPGGEFDMDTPAPKITITAEPQGDVVVDTDPAATEREKQATGQDTLPDDVKVVIPQDNSAAPAADASAPAPQITPTESPEEIDMSNVSAEDILKEFIQMDESDQISTAAPAQTSAPAPQEDALSKFLDEELAKLGGGASAPAAPAAASAPAEDEVITGLNEQEQAELLAMLNEDVLKTEVEEKEEAKKDEKKDGEELDEHMARTHANGRVKTSKPGDFPEDKKRPGQMNEDIARLVELMPAVLKENDELKAKLAKIEEDTKALTSLNEGLEKQTKELRGIAVEATLVAYKTGAVNKLLMEHTTTQEDKKVILESFTKASTQAETQTLFEKFTKELNKDGKTTLNENKSVAEKINPAVNSQKGGESEKIALNESAKADATQKHLDRVKVLMGYKYAK